MYFILAFFLGLFVYGFTRVVFTAFYTVRPDERAVITTFGRANRLSAAKSEDDLVDGEAHEDRYDYPAVAVVKPGGPYFKWPWQTVHKVSIATQAIDITWDPHKHQDTIEAVTKDNLTTGVNGQIRFRVSENNLYAYLFGVESPLEHVMGFFISVLRERIANFVDPRGASLIAPQSDVDGEGTSETAVELSEGVSINDIRKNLPLINQYMEEQCRCTEGRYGVELDAALITEIDPPAEVDRALSAINSTRNQVAADISTARADAEQQITMSNRAVEIATNNAQAEVAPLQALAGTLSHVKAEGGSRALQIYLRNLKVPLLGRTRRLVQTLKQG